MRAGRIRSVGVLLVALSAMVGAASGGTLASFSNVTSNAGNGFQTDSLDPPSDLSVSEICGGGGIAFRGGTSNGTDASPLVLNRPAGLQEEDLMLAVVVTRFSTDNIGAPSGWTMVRNDAPGGRQKIFYKVAGAGEPSSYSFSGTGRSAGGIVAYEGVDTSSPIDVENAQTGSGSTITAPSITTTVADAMLVGFFSIGDSSSMTSPSSMTQRFSRASTGSGGSGHHVRVNVAEQPFGGPGATGTRQASSAGSAWNLGVLVALRPIPTQWDASLSWTATSSSWAEGYKLQRWVGAAQQDEQTITPRTETSATDGPLAADTPYTFKLTAFSSTWRSAEAIVTLTTGSTCGATGGGSEAYREAVMDDSPGAYWRLGEMILADDFENFNGWTDEGSGTFQASTEQSRSGTGSGKKATNSDPHGGSKGLGTTLGNAWTLETWIYRPSVYSGGAADRIGLEDASGNGYSFAVLHDANTIRIDRRTASTGTSINSATVDPPEDAWFRAVLSRSGSSMTFAIYDQGGTQLGQVTASDSTYSSFTRVVVRGGHHYYVDDLSVSAPASGLTAVDETGSHNATYQGGVTLGRPGALAADPDTAVFLDGNDDYVIRNPFNGMPSTAISVEFWMKSSDTSKDGTPVSYATSSNDNAFLIYNYRNFTIYTGGSNVSTGVSANDGAWHHIVVTWRSSDGQTRLYKDGAQAWSGTLSAGTSIPNGGSLVLGQEQDSVGGGFQVSQAFLGDLDEVAIYDKVLSASRIQAHHDAAAATGGSAPAAPTGLTATAVSSSRIDLSWTDNSSNEAGFRIERSPGGAGSWTEIDSVGADVTTYQNTGLSPGTAYDYRVRASNATGESDYSNVASATTGGIAFVKNVGTVVCGGTSSVLTVPAAGVAAGNTLILRMHVHNTTTGTIGASDSKGNTYTVDANGIHDGKGRMTILSARVATALVAGDTITVTHPDSKSEGLVVDEFSGIAATDRVDATGTGANKSATPSASVTTTTAYTLLYGGLWLRSNPTFTQASGWTDLTTLATTGGGSCETAMNRGAYRIVSSAGSHTWSPTLGNNEEWAAALVAYRPA